MCSASAVMRCGDAGCSATDHGVHVFPTKQRLPLYVLQHCATTAHAQHSAPQLARHDPAGPILQGGVTIGPTLNASAFCHGAALWGLELDEAAHRVSESAQVLREPLPVGKLQGPVASQDAHSVSMAHYTTPHHTCVTTTTGTHAFTSFINTSKASSSRARNSAGCDEMKLSLNCANDWVATEHDKRVRRQQPTTHHHRRCA